MGSGNFTAKDWNSYSSSVGISSNSSYTDIYKRDSIHKDLDPRKMKNAFRESCDSNEHPFSTPIIFAVDNTGSLGELAAIIAKEVLKDMMEELYTKSVVLDPQIMFMGIGDAYTDESPLQASQFESDVRIAEQLTNLYLEGGGGGNGGESYLLAWYFAARKTKIDSFIKRGKKGFIFTIGDEPNHSVLTKEQIKRITGDDVERDLTAEELLTEVSRQYEVFHLIVKDGEKRFNSKTKWTKLIGERAIEVNDYKDITRIVISTLEIIQGKAIDQVVSQWDGSTTIMLQKAIGGLSVVNTSTDLVEFN